MTILSQILEHKIISIVRGTELQHMLPVALALHAGGIRLIEVTMNTPGALEAIRLLRAEFGDDMAIGAGTVLDPESARAALLAGASFLLSPSLNVETIRLTKRYGAVSIPGAYTPTEIVTAYEYGADIVKIFPADAISPSFIKSLRGPLPQIPLMPTGGIDLDNIRSFVDAGAAAIGIGSSLVPAKWDITTDSLEQLTHKAAQFVRATQ
ncbi:bifunctional 4-hydroxy-2-oxoglutarate aldolase/2-dehydro-3-deoxy-phosphogluconate aldolase [Paenibacillus alba]|uniref:bifunctional 4-hydroxy-2-oxoglutarate aldolase/2-dehydro-3-deoxy-phosphogluconate aldolase n=1 Tax=Paenibacillus alba TaxID=1197127 RepID=UPI00156489A7|nr:bifunctional 4-hydroxy-2-oxoglutarate aldolase/2-dehydro-3-deoxy-phosphogluconate aldolase [Paenibacillus alba]NQX67545.1 bifunctional 4-hydroxy-2-oxoglutarate aldolase/2-dehydro-3-deoxy-phosphogluconate aldolase [Paenibacillus alba]